MPSPPATRQSVLRLIRKRNIRAQRYLDLGCSEGDFTLEIAKLVGAAETWGVDIDDNALIKAKERGIRVVKANLEVDTLPFPDEYFDLITAIEVVEHLRYVDVLLKEAYRVLKRQGYFIVSTPNLSSWINRVLLLLGYQPMHTEPSKYYHVGLPIIGYRTKQNYVGHINVMTFKALVKLLELYGFKVIDKCGIHWHVRYKLLNYVDRLFSKIPSLAHAITLLAVKV